MRWSTVLPIDQPTKDGRVLHAVRLERPWPLPLLLSRTTETTFDRILAVGQIGHADIDRKNLRLAGTVWSPATRPPGSPDLPLSAFLEDDWYAVCDLVDTTVLPYHAWFRRRLQMTGTLAAMTLVDRPAWRRQQPVHFTP